VPGTYYTVLASTGPAESPDTYFSAWYKSSPLFVTMKVSKVTVSEGQSVSGMNIGLQPLFIDVAQGSMFYPDIVWMQGSGITLGCGGDAYCAPGSVTRAQMATSLVRALGLSGTSTDYFDDDDGNIHEDNINTMRANGVTLGCSGDGLQYCPDNSVRRDHMAAFLFRALTGS
jgi:hypothetical protein